MKKSVLRIAIYMLCTVMLWTPATGAQAKTVAQWLEGYASGENWFGEGYAYDINDTQAVWDLLMNPINVLDVGEREVVALRVEPNGAKVN